MERLSDTSPLCRRQHNVKHAILGLMENPKKYNNPELMLEGLNSLLINLETND